MKKIRDIKKYGKRVQIEVEQRKVKEKKEMIEKLNKYRKVSVCEFCGSFITTE